LFKALSDHRAAAGVARPTESINSSIATRDCVIKSAIGNSCCPFFLERKVFFADPGLRVQGVVVSSHGGSPFQKRSRNPDSTQNRG
jgi:hypothetical protein